MGCWAIGGPYTFEGQAVGWGEVDDAESERAIRRALELGITFFDTAASYGAGHSERVLGRTLRDVRDRVIIATKFGITFDERRREMTGRNLALTRADVRAECEGSLQRLGTDRIDIFQLHPGEYPLERAPEVVEALEELVQEGLIRTYGWSINHVEGVEVFAKGEHCSLTQNGLNLLNDQPDFLRACERLNLAWLCNGPLAMGLLTGKFSEGQSLPKNDIRGVGATWMQPFRDGKPNPEWLEKLASVREILTSGGRTLAQGALAWIWGRSPLTVPIPGIRTVAQAEENAGAMAFGPLTPEQMGEIEQILRRAD